MNVPRNLQYYSQILLFKNDPSRVVLVIEKPSKPDQRVLQALAHEMDLEFDHNAVLRQAIISRPNMWGDNVEFIDSPHGLNNSSNDQPHIFEHLGSNEASATSFPEVSEHSSMALDTISQNTTHGPAVGSVGVQAFEVRDQVPSSIQDHLVLDLPADMEQCSGTDRESFAEDFVARNHGDTESIQMPNLGLLDIPETAAPSFISCASSFQGVSAGFSDALNLQLTKNGQTIRNRVHKSRSRISSAPSDTSYSFSYFESHKFASHLSVTSGRRGPLDNAAKSAMRAVTAAKACWRCKILRRRVSLSSRLF